jgi:hypothetical protein
VQQPRLNPQRQSGAILVVGLVLLLVLTVLGISTMSTASLELNMAGNDQFYENAFQIAESGLDVNIANLNAGVGVPPPLNPGVCPAFNAPVAVPNMGGTVSTRICFSGDIPDLSGSSSIGKIRQYHFITESRGVSQGGASSWHHQGLFVQGPDGL